MVDRKIIIEKWSGDEEFVNFLIPTLNEESKYLGFIFSKKEAENIVKQLQKILNETSYTKVLEQV